MSFLSLEFYKSIQISKYYLLSYVRNFHCSYQSHQRNLRDRQQSERLQEAAAAGEPDDISAENVPEPNANDVGENEERNDAPSAVPNSDNESTPPLASSSDEQAENRLPAITLLRTFILSFFSSLIPETPAV